MLNSPWKLNFTSESRSRLEHLNQHIPSYTAHLAGRPVEDAGYAIQLWQPRREHPTLIPVPEQGVRPVLEPVSAYDEAHEAMLEAMETNADAVPQEVMVVEARIAPCRPRGRDGRTRGKEG